jgi:ribonuclease BN (tRNA processing enzyme)
MSTKLKLLGTGTPSPLLHRAGSSYLVTLNDEMLLFDCGPFSIRRLMEAGVLQTDITSLFLTHLHYDHCMDYGYLILSRWDQGAGQISELNVYGPPPLQRVTERLIGEDGAFGPDLAARTQHVGSHFIYEMRGGVLPRERPAPRVREVSAGEIIESENWKVQVAEVVHCQPQLTCLAYRLDTEDASVVFGGDTAPTESLTTLAEGADVLIHMCHFINGVVTDERITSCCSGHLDAAKTATVAGVKTLVLVHITEQVNQPGIRERILKESGAHFEGNIIFGEDLLDVPLAGVEPEIIQ